MMNHSLLATGNVLLALAVLAPAAAQQAPAAEPATTVNRVVLRVNDEIATLHDYQQQVSDRRVAILGAELDPERRQELLDRVSHQVIRETYEELLLLSRADVLGIEVREEEVQEAIANAQQRMGLETEAELDAALASSGMDREQLRQRMRRSVLLQKVMAREVQSRIDVSDEELRRVYREGLAEYEIPAALRLREVIVLDAAEQAQEAEARAREVLRQLEGGATLDEVAATWAENGEVTGVIDLGWVEAGDLDPELEATAWELEPGQHSEAVAARGGLHILELVERREPGVRPFEEVKGELLAREQDRRLGEEYRTYLDEVEEQAFVEMDLPPEAAGFTGLGEEEADEEELPGELVLEPREEG